METMDHQDRRNCLIEFLDDGGDCDDRVDHIETRLNSIRAGGASEARMTKLTTANQKPLTL